MVNRRVVTTPRRRHGAGARNTENANMTKNTAHQSYTEARDHRLALQYQRNDLDRQIQSAKIAEARAWSRCVEAMKNERDYVTVTV